MKTVIHDQYAGETGRITTIVADDSPSFLYGFCHYLRSDASTCIVGTADNGFEAIDMVRRMRPQLVVMDFHMPGLPGDHAAAWITEHFPGIHVLLVSSDEHPRIEPSIANDTWAFMCKTDLMSDFSPLVARWFPNARNAIAASTN